MKRGLCLWYLFLAGSLAAADASTPSIRTNVPAPAALTRTNAPPPVVAARTNAPAPVAAKPADLPKNLQLERGFRIERVAGDSLVAGPIAMAFDENGRLFVLEKTGNPGKPGGNFGRIRLLEDIDGDGVFDGGSVYADNLNDPTALICYGGGVFVAVGGQVQYLKDTAFDGAADMHREIFKSLGDATNGTGGQVLITGFAWGLDNRIHVTTGGHGGDVISSSSPSQSVILTSGNFSFDPRTFRLTPENGYASAGMVFDNRGRVIAANHNQPSQMVMYEARYAARNPSARMPDALLTLANEGASMDQPLSADSIAIYRGSAFPLEYWSDLFVADAARGVIHREKLRQRGVELYAENPPIVPGTEFLMARDSSFQIAQVLSGPDGGLYLATSTLAGSISSKTKTNVNVSFSPAKSGIYRVVPLAFKQPKPPQLSRATSDQLVLLLRHPNGWLRDSAARLLYERQDRSAIVPLIRLLFDAQAPPLARMHALHALDGLHVTADGRAGNALMEPHVLKALADADDRVREHGVLLAERFITPAGAISDALWDRLAGLAGDASPQVRYQLAFTLGQARHAGRSQVLAQIIRADSTNRWIRAAVASSLDEGAADLLDTLAGDAEFRNRPGGVDFLRELFETVGAKNQPEEVARALGDLNRIPEAQFAFTLARAFDNSLQRADSSLAAADKRGALQPLYNNAARVVLDNNADESVRVSALRLLSGVQSVDPGMVVGLLVEWPALKPRMRRETMASIFSQPARVVAMLQAMEEDMLAKAEISSSQLRYLLSVRDVMTQGRVKVLYPNGLGNRSRQPIVSTYLPALQMTGRADSGRAIFTARCAACHQVNGEGNPVGVKLTGLAKDEKLLTRILNPNRQPPVKYPATYVEMTSGETAIGFVAREMPKSISICEENGEERVVGLSNIKSRVDLGFSTMPDGLEAGLSQQDMADLLTYIAGQ